MNKELKRVGALVLATIVGLAVAAWIRLRRPAPPPCIFCNKDSGSEEHFWPAWVHRFIKENKINLGGGLRVQLGNQPETITNDLEKTINTVCHTCNNTWMSQIEDKSVSRFKRMLRNESLTVDPGGMKIITEWAVLRAIMLDSEKPSIGRETFYTRQERAAMKERLEIPARTRVWFGALDEFHLGGHGTDFTIEGVNTDGSKVRVGTGCYNTVYMGYLVAQIFTEHIHATYQSLDFQPIQPLASICDERLVQIHPRPKLLKSFNWPTTPFTNGGPNGIGYLMYRWKVGATPVSEITRAGVIE